MGLEDMLNELAKEVKVEEIKEEKPEKKEEVKEPVKEEKPVKKEEKKSVVTKAKQEKKEKPSNVVNDLPDIGEIVEEDEDSGNEVYLIFGEKGSGKTVTAMSFEGELVVLSFDKKSTRVKSNWYDNDKRIHVFNVVKYLDYEDQKTITESSAKTYAYILKVLEHARDNIKPDWVIIDGAELFSQVCEMTMRYRHGLLAFQGVSNLNLWKERGMLIRKVHNMALDIAKRGIIYTTYTDYDEIVYEGELITKKQVPKWIDVLIFETDYVLKTESHDNGKKFIVKVVTSKNDKVLKTGSVYDVTDGRFWDVVREKEVKE